MATGENTCPDKDWRANTVPVFTTTIVTVLCTSTNNFLTQEVQDEKTILSFSHPLCVLEDKSVV